jgi:hypothetical protein
VKLLHCHFSRYSQNPSKAFNESSCRYFQHLKTLLILILLSAFRLVNLHISISLSSLLLFYYLSVLLVISSSSLSSFFFSLSSFNLHLLPSFPAYHPSIYLPSTFPLASSISPSHLHPPRSFFHQFSLIPTPVYKLHKQLLVFLQHSPEISNISTETPSIVIFFPEGSSRRTRKSYNLRILLLLTVAKTNERKISAMEIGKCCGEAAQFFRELLECESLPPNL